MKLTWLDINILWTNSQMPHHFMEQTVWEERDAGVYSSQIVDGMIAYHTSKLLN